MEYWKTQNNQDPYWPYQDPQGATREHWQDGAATTFNLNLVRFQDYSLYWRNYVHMDDTNRQVRQVGWQWEAGVSMADRVEGFWYHHSQHVLDAQETYHFPLVNRYGVRVIFYQRDRK